MKKHGLVPKDTAARALQLERMLVKMPGSAFVRVRVDERDNRLHHVWFGVFRDAAAKNLSDQVFTTYAEMYGPQIVGPTSRFNVEVYRGTSHAEEHDVDVPDSPPAVSSLS